MLFRIIIIIFAYVGMSSDAQAYLGPGLGAGTVAAVLGVFGAVFLGLIAVIYYPVKRMLKKRKQDTKTSDDGGGQVE